MNRLTGILSILVIFINSVFPACAGEKSPFAAKRIISLVPSVTEFVFLLNAEDRLMGCTNYCIRPEAARNVPRVGTVMKINLEVLIALNPDLVIASSLSDQKTLEKIKNNFPIRIEVLPKIKTFKELCSDFIRVGQLVQNEEKAKALVLESQKRLMEMSKKTEGYYKPSVFVQIGVKPLFTATKDSFIHEMISCAGGINIAENAGNGIYSREMVVKTNPDVIIIAAMDGYTDMEINFWKSYKTINAVKNKRVYVLDPYKICSPTPVTFVESVADIAECLHGKEEDFLSRRDAETLSI